MLSQRLPGKLQGYGFEALLAGKPMVLYHGTTRTFDAFDVKKARKELVDEYYGEGLFFVPTKRVAEKYANANRNMGFEPSIVTDLKHANPKAGAFMEALFKRGDAAWDDFTPEKLRVQPEDFMAAARRAVGGVDPNTVADVARFVLGSKLVPSRSSEPVNIFNMSTGLPDYVYKMLDELGLDSAKCRPKVYTVTVTVRKTLVTASKSAARGARARGYDSVLFYGDRLVDDVPEVAVLDAGRADVKILRVEEA